jgi:hypothetical protein
MVYDDGEARGKAAMRRRILYSTVLAAASFALLLAPGALSTARPGGSG